MGWFWDTLSRVGANNPLFVIIVMISAAIYAVIVLNGLFVKSSNVRDNVLFSDINSFILGFTFIYIILKFMGEKMTILGKEIDVGLILYFAMTIFVLFILGG
jgi:hypothetical protein